MNYQLKGFVVKNLHRETLNSRQHLKAVPLRDGFFLVPLTYALKSEVFREIGEDMDYLHHLTKILSSDNQPVAFLDISAYKRKGEFLAKVLVRGFVVWGGEGKESINEALKRIGVVHEEQAKDEFTYLGLGRIKSTEDWVKNQK